MHVITVDFIIKPDFVDRFRKRVQQQARDSLANEPGCSVFDVCIDSNAPDRVVLYEVYASADAFAEHLASDHFKAFDVEVAAWVRGKKVQQLQRL